MIVRRLLGIVVLWFVGAAVCQAHKPSDSYLLLQQGGQGASLTGQWDIALRDLQHALNLDTDGNGRITWGELKSRRDALVQYALPRLSVEAVARGDRGACELSVSYLLFDRHVDGGYAVLRFAAQCPFRPAQLVLHYSLFFELDPNHRGLLSIRAAGHDQSLLLADTSRSATVNLGSPDRLGQFRAFLDEGIWHIWKGYDHVYFCSHYCCRRSCCFATGDGRPASLCVKRFLTS